jgi:hypothetical protein
MACLYTDLGNPYSNRCYANIGFTPMCDSYHIPRGIPARLIPLSCSPNLCMRSSNANSRVALVNQLQTVESEKVGARFAPYAIARSHLRQIGTRIVHCNPFCYAAHVATAKVVHTRSARNA